MLPQNELAIVAFPEIQVYSDLDYVLRSRQAQKFKYTLFYTGICGNDQFAKWGTEFY